MRIYEIDHLVDLKVTLGVDALRLDPPDSLAEQ
jgi:hypothetical protein